MKRFSLLAVLALSSVSAQAAEDLNLPGALWLAKPVGYVCEADPATAVNTPASLEHIGLVFESFTADATLVNGLVKATFVENGVSCRYSALLQADYTTRLLQWLDSRAYAVDASSDCATGKATLDAAFTADRFTYWGSPRHLTFLVNDATNAAAICGEGATAYGIDFVLSGRI